MKNALKSNIDSDLSREGEDGATTVAHLGIAPGVIETMVEKAVLGVPGVAGVGSPKIDSGFTSILSRPAADNGVTVARDGGHLVLDIRIRIFYGYKLQDIVDGIRISVADSIESQIGVTVDAINVYVAGIQFEE